MLRNIRIVLVGTSHSGNIGSVARAMKTMELTNLYLVSPLVKPNSLSVSLAADAKDILDNAIFIDSLDMAIADCILVVGTSARLRSLSWPRLQMHECGIKCVENSISAPVAIVFGRERIGLTNAELQKCHYYVKIPTSKQYSSLNLAMAVQIVAYEVYIAYLQKKNRLQKIQNKEIQYPLSKDLEYFYEYMEKLMIKSCFIRHTGSTQVMNKLRRLYTRARLEHDELNILLGMFASFERKKNNN